MKNEQVDTDSRSKIPNPEIAISVQNLTKIYKLYNTPLDRLKESINPFGRKYHNDFHALNDVSFEIKKGETVGIIGKNGSGKSTLLKIITGVLTPTSGNVTANGKVSALLELGTGFNPELTGVENVYFNGMLMGYTREDMDGKLDEILSFADIGEFIYQPVKMYSSGMFVRLAFAVGVSVNPDILIVDEALSVGDAYFQKKCMNRMDAIKESGATILFVSHDATSIKSLCGLAILLEHGTAVKVGSAAHVVDVYESMLLKEAHSGSRSVDVEMPSVERSGVAISTGEIELLSVAVTDTKGNVLREITSDTHVSIEYTLKALRAIEEPHYGLSIRNKYNISIFETNTLCMGISTVPLAAGQTVTIKFEMLCTLAPGDYFISVGVANKAFGKDDFREYLLWLYDVKKVSVVRNKDSQLFSGIYNMKPNVSIGC